VAAAEQTVSSGCFLHGTQDRVVSTPYACRHLAMPLDVLGVLLSSLS
jgi:hypothetical protein